MLTRLHRYACGLLLLPGLAGMRAQSQAPVDTYEVIAKYPHSTASYTEGFFYRDGLFYEGTGLKGHSEVLVINPESGKPLQQMSLPAQYFGEGIVDWGPDLYEWTWQSHICFVYDRFSLRPVRQFTYTGDGWGMTRTAKEIITSDGSAVLRFRDPTTFKQIRHILVHDGSRPIQQLNELEYIKGEIYANVWHSDRIARISPKDGRVLAWIDLSGILADSQKIDSESVLNGIAYDAAHDRLFVTGKQWPWVFEIKMVARPPMAIMAVPR
ncbi:MAG TPA: glutaminyl-peptide cyclotransferase [Edaphobacter sp.]|nr:glutaminyl-peptide cyclotransferase [Edaphobacter sp.]